MDENKIKARIMDETAVTRALIRISHEITERNDGVDDIAVIGIQRRGVPLGKEIVHNIFASENVNVPFGILDITLYRDDLSMLSDVPQINGTDIPFTVTGKRVVLVDDVIYTGRTVRAAIDAIMDCGRPKQIQLAVLIDRGHRELPIRPDYIGKNIPTSKDEIVHVMVPQFDNEKGVVITERNKCC